MTGRRAGLCVAMFVALVCTSAAQNVGANDKQFQAALQKEMVAGDLVGAIEEYRAIAERPGVDRSLAATALLRMAGAYEKLGEAQARDTYQRIVDHFADQRTQVVEAQARLGALTPAVPTDGPTVLPRPPDDVVGGGLDYAMTPDGRYGIFTAYTDEGQNVGLFEYATARVAWSTSLEYDDQAEGLVVSPDGSRMAYSVARRNEGATEVYVGPLGGQVERIYREENPDVLAETGPVPIWLTGWTPDDVLVGRRWIGGGWESIVTLEIATGELKQIQAIPPEQPSVGEVSPDGQTIAVRKRVDDHEEIYAYAVDGSANFPLTNNSTFTSIDNLIWSRDGRHLLFAAVRPGGRDLWAVPVENGQQAGGAFLLQPDFTGTHLARAADRLSYFEAPRVRGVFAMSLDGSADRGGSIARATYSATAQERFGTWSRQGDLAFISQDGSDFTLAIQHPDGRTRERPVPVELPNPQVIGFNVEGTTVAVYATSRHEQLALYDLATNAWSFVTVPAVAPAWQKRLGYAAFKGGPDAYVVYYPVTKRDPETSNYGPLEIHRLDARGEHSTVFSSGERLHAGGRPLWLSEDGRSLRFGEGTVYRELDLATGGARDLLSLGEPLWSNARGEVYSLDGDGPVSSSDGTTVAMLVSADRGADYTLRALNLTTGTSKDITLSKDQLLKAVGLPPGSDARALLSRFRLSTTGDQLAFDLDVRSFPSRIVVDDPLEKFLRDRGGR